MENQDSNSENARNEMQHEIQDELEQARRSLKEVSLMLEQSQAELNKLTQRNSGITGHLQQIQAQIESAPRADILNAYNAALDVQQRLLVMRGQMEKLQGDQATLQRWIALLTRANGYFNQVSESSQAGHANGSGSAILEMVINGQESVRQRLSREMHDGPAQALSNFIVQTEIATRLFDIDPEKAKDELHNLRTAAMSTFQKVRSFIFELRPMMLDDLGLFPTLKRYVDALKEQSGVEISLRIKGQERRLEPYLEVMIFRAVQELLGNAIRHNQDHPVKIQVSVQITIEDTLILIAVADNGRGFDQDSIAESHGLGLKLIRERVDMLGGVLRIDSSIGQGSKITFQVPCLEIESKDMGISN
ncbi:MAG: sensor histidine kinase [Anaerolineaceae bacterium]|nr:sensor histidine kinase [Anaerolineaceae bacterium]